MSSDDRRLEITNSFPTARAEPLIDNDEITQNNTFYEEQKQTEMLDMLRKFRFLIFAQNFLNSQIFIH